jgi:transposase
LASRPPPDDDHRCGWRDHAEQLQTELDQLRSELDVIKRHVFGKRSEKMPSMDREVRAGSKADPAAAQRKRLEKAEQKARLLAETVELKVAEHDRCCPKCGNSELRSAGVKETTVYEYRPGTFHRCVYARETLSCTCGEYIVTAPPPDKSTDKTRYGAGFVAHLITAKCADAIPLYRLEKEYQRIGVPIARSTMTDLFHRNAQVLAPLYERLLARIAGAEIVQADETPMRMQTTKKRAYIWTFLAGKLVGYRFSPSRSGRTPCEVLGGTRGTLVVDAYSGYNPVVAVDGRERAGCLAHARRKLFDSLSSAPEAQAALEIIRDIYVVEHEAKQAGVARTKEHLAMRQTRSAPLMQKLRAWLLEQQAIHPPKSPLGRAARYALDNWTELTRFLDDERLPPDNNASESALRRVALGRKNWLFVGHEDAGDNIAGLYSLVATCEANDVNPVDYLADVLIRVQTHPADRIDELLPDAWRPTNA